MSKRNKPLDETKTESIIRFLQIRGSRGATVKEICGMTGLPRNTWRRHYSRALKSKVMMRTPKGARAEKNGRGVVYVLAEFFKTPEEERREFLEQKARIANMIETLEEKNKAASEQAEILTKKTPRIQNLREQVKYLESQLAKYERHECTNKRAVICPSCGRAILKCPDCGKNL